MSSATLYRLSAIALLFGGIIAAIGTLAQTFLSDDYANSLWVPVAFFIFLGTLLVQIGLPALYVRQMKQVGLLGLIGFILLFCGFAQFGIGFRFFDIAILPWFGKSADVNPPASFILYSLSAEVLVLVGALLFGIATIRVRVLQKIPVILLFVSFLLNRVGGHVPYLQDIGGMLFFLSFAWLGFVLLSLVRPEVGQESAHVPVGTNVRA